MGKNFKSSLFSRCFGSFASCEFPSFFQLFINRSYVFFMKVDLNEFNSIDSYKTLNALFTRELLSRREFDTDQKSIISPCDGYISELGDIKDDKALQIKGSKYSVSQLLGNEFDAKRELEGGKYINFYLSPKDYHRYHVPCDMRVTKAVHIPGKLYPVNFKWLNKIPNLFIENERVVLECKDENDNLFYMVFVGALNVGKMVFNFDSRLKTNIKEKEYTVYEYRDREIFLKKGDELGRFEMGSTIVMFFKKDYVEFTCKALQSVKFGHTVAIKI